MISKAHPSIHGGEVTRQASGWRRQLTRTSCQREGWKTGTAATFSDEVGAPVAGGILRRGGEEEEAQVQVYPEKKVARRCSGLCSPWRGSRRRRLSDNDGGALGQRHGARTQEWRQRGSDTEDSGSGDGEARRSRGGGAHACVAAALCSDNGSRSEWVRRCQDGAFKARARW
jgi:hypothetical protein